jgi:hypothetical protein
MLIWWSVEAHMNYRIRAYPWAGQESHVNISIQGRLNPRELKAILHKIKALTETLTKCKFLIDLSDARLRLDPLDIQFFVSECASDEWFHGSKVALVSASESQPQLLSLAASLANRGFKIAAFDNAKLATDWLTETIW